MEERAKQGANGGVHRDVFLKCLQPMFTNEKFWAVIGDIRTLLHLMQVNRHTYQLLSPKDHLLPFWDIWMRVFRPHSYSEIRIMFALNR